jgi:hypothetical protein
MPVPQSFNVREKMQEEAFVKTLKDFEIPPEIFEAWRERK